MFKRHRKSRRERATDLLVKYLKLETAGKAATTVARRTPKKGLLAVAGGVGAAAAALAARKLRGSQQPAPA